MLRHFLAFVQEEGFREAPKQRFYPINIASIAFRPIENRIVKR